MHNQLDSNDCGDGVGGGYNFCGARGACFYHYDMFTNTLITDFCALSEKKKNLLKFSVIHRKDYC